MQPLSTLGPAATCSTKSSSLALAVLCAAGMMSGVQTPSSRHIGGEDVTAKTHSIQSFLMHVNTSRYSRHKQLTSSSSFQDLIFFVKNRATFEIGMYLASCNAVTLWVVKVIDEHSDSHWIAWFLQRGGAGVAAVLCPDRMPPSPLP